MKPRMVSLFERTCGMVAGEPIPAVARWDAVVLRNEPGDRNACKIVEQRQHGFPDGSADVLEVDVDATWTCSGQSRRKIGGAMINRGVEAKLVLHEGAFLRTAGDANGFALASWASCPTSDPTGPL